MKPAICVAVLCWALQAAAQGETAALPTDAVELAREVESLDKGLQDWSETSLRVGRSFGSRHALDVLLRETRRFGQGDTAVGLSYSRPLDERWTLLAEAGGSPTHRILPATVLGASLQNEFAPAWLLLAGLKRTTYDHSVVEQGVLMLEHYFSSFSASIAWRPVRALGRHADGVGARASYYYGDRNSVGVILTSGQEATAVGNQNVVLADVRAAALTGRHWLASGWALTWALARTRQGSFYSRSGLRLGVQHAF